MRPILCKRPLGPALLLSMGHRAGATELARSPGTVIGLRLCKQRPPLLPFSPGSGVSSVVGFRGQGFEVCVPMGTGRWWCFPVCVRSDLGDW